MNIHGDTLGPSRMIIKGVNVHGTSTTDGGASSLPVGSRACFPSRAGSSPHRSGAVRARTDGCEGDRRQEAEPGFEIVGDTGKLILVMPFEEAIDEN